MATIGSLSVKLGLVTVEWDQATDKAKKQAKDLQNSINNLGKEMSFFKNTFGQFAGGFNLMGIGFAALTQHALSLSHEVQDLSDAFGISVEKILQIREALERSGVSAENAGRMMSTLYKNLSEAQKGLGGPDGVVLKFQQLGLNIYELEKLSPEKAFETITAAIGKLGNAFERSEYVKALFGGKGARTFDTTKFAEEMDKASESAKNHEEAMRKLDGIDKDIKENLDHLTIAFADLLSKFVGDKGLVVSTEKFKLALEIIVTGLVIKSVYALAVALLEVASSFVVVATAATAAKVATGDWITAAGGAIALVAGGTALYKMDLFGDKINDLKKNMDSSTASIQKNTEATDANGNSKSDAAAKAAKANEKLFGQYTEQLTIAKEELKYQKELAQVKLDAYTTDTFTTKAAEIRLKYAQEEEKLRAQMKKEIGQAENPITQGIIKQTYKTRIAMAKEAMDSELQLNEIDRKNQQDFVSGWNQAYTQWKIDSANYGKAGADAFNSMIGSMNTAIDNFVKTGKLNFKSLIAEIIQGIISAELKMQASKLFGGFNWSSLLGIFSGGSSASSTAGVNASLGNMYIPSLLTSTHATGGNVYANQPTLVGEKGPEMIIPKNAGTVIPNNQLSSMMGNQPAIVYNGPYINNMSAIDTQSATQFLAKNKQGVWAANQSAQLSLPQSR
jgi:lambda family phage tail tape measure protein